MSWIGDWFGSIFTRDKRKYFVKLIVKAIQLFLGSATKAVWENVRAEVELAEASEQPGAKKAKMVFDRIRKRIGEADVPTFLLNLMIESAVTVLKAERGKLG